MRCRLLAFLLFLIASNILFSQVYPIPAKGAEWNNTVIDFQTVIENQTTTRLEVKGDTLIDSVKYSKLFASWEVGYYQTGACEFSSSGIGGSNINRYEGAIRTDEKNRVHYIHSGTTETLTLYDFSLSVGDSVLLSEVSNPYYAYVIEIEQILVGDSQRMKFLMEGMYGNEDIWIEGIGSLYGLLSTEFRLWEFHQYELSCYEEEGITLYTSDPSCTRCEIVTKVVPKRLSDCASIFPLPITGKSIVRWPISMNPKRIIVYNLCGQKVYSKAIFEHDKFIIDRDDLEKGVLIMELIDESGFRYTDQIIVL